MVEPEFENSSLQTSVPEAMFGDQVCMATSLLPAEVIASALTVVFEASRKGAKYWFDVAEGVPPFSV